MKNERFVKFDSHAHLTSDELFPRMDEIIENALKVGVEKIMNINTDLKTLERALEIKDKYDKILYNTVATTPHDVDLEGEMYFPIFEKAIKEKKVDAIGETGLDYYYEHSKKDTQKAFLKAYFDLAQRTKRSVVIHCRGDDAFKDLYKTPHDISAVIHCFTGNLYQAQAALERGWYISISGIATFKKSSDLRAVIKEIPIEKLLIETDSPYLAPQSMRGKENEPAFIEEVAMTIACEKDLKVEDVCKITFDNAASFFQIESHGIQKPML
jgi:TatD DNase family protein